MGTLISARQGSPEWLAARAGRLSASDAPAMMGESPYATRQSLIHRLATGKSQPVGAELQALFDRGHAAEAAAVARAEMAALCDFATGTCYILDCDGLPLLASPDGISHDGKKIWEHKLYSQKKADLLAQKKWPHDVWQLEQQLLVTGADSVLYHLSDDTRESVAWYRSDPQRRAALIAGWHRLLADISAYKRTLAAQVAEPETALAVVAEGRIISSNVAEFSAVINEWLAKVAAETDPGAAVAHAKRCKSIQDRCEALRDGVIGQTADISAVVTALSAIAAEARSVRLKLEKLADSEANKAKATVVAAAHARLNDARGNHPLAPRVDLASAGKGKRTLDSYRQAVEGAADEAIRAWEAARPIEDEATLVALVGCGLDAETAASLLGKIKNLEIPRVRYEQ